MTDLETIKRNGYPCSASEFWWLIDRVIKLEAAIYNLCMVEDDEGLAAVGDAIDILRVLVRTEAAS